MGEPRSRYIEYGIINILVVGTARISSEISHGTSSVESENDLLRGQGPNTQVPYRGICQWASSSSSSSSSQARGLRFADSCRMKTVLDVITREITCGFERALSPLPHLHFHSAFLLYLPPIDVPSLFQLLLLYLIRPMCVVPCIFSTDPHLDPLQ